MRSNSKMKALLAIVLSISLLATGCSAQWISVALADLPVLTQMALNIAALVATLQSGKQLSLSEATAIQNISNEAGKDLALLQTLYNQYKANPSVSTLQKIQTVIAEIDRDLPALLQAAHIIDPVLTARISAAVNLIVTTVNSIASLIPQTTTSASRKATAPKKIVILGASELKKQWNQQVCAPSGSATLDPALAACALK